MGVLIPVWFIALFLKNRRNVIFFTIGSLAGLAPLVYYHLYYWGSIMKGGYFGLIREGNYFSTFRPLYHLAAHLFSPSRGLLIFSPFFILVPVSLAPRLRSFRPNNYHVRLWGFSSLALALVIICYRKWWTGYGYGPRYWTDILPLLCLLSIPAATWLGNRSWGKCIIALLVLYCIFIQALGAWRYDAGWDRGVDVDKHPEACWNLRDNAIFYCLSGGASHAEPLGPPGSYLIDNNILHMGKPENNRFLYSGFYPQEAWGTWTRANYPGVIYFRLPRKQDGHLVFVVKAPSSPLSPKKIKFLVNGHLAGEHEFKNNAWEAAQPDYVALSLPAASLSGEWEKLKITCSEGTFKGPGFSYFFGFALIQLGWFDDETFLRLKTRFSEYPYTK
jgi:hypothetical protein